MANTVSLQWSERTRRTLLFLLIALVMALAVLLIGNRQVNASVSCQPVHGHFNLIPMTETCNSPVGVCARGSFNGGIQGDYTSEQTAFIPTDDTPVTGLILFTGDTTVAARVGSSVGDLLFKEGGAFSVAGGGDFSETFVVVGGTGSFDGATGLIHAFGAFDATTGGQAVYDGTICVQ